MRTGVFGGTFDPPHLGHLVAAGDAVEALCLDRLLFVPSADPPHKRGAVQASAEIRLEMIRAAVLGDPRFRVDDLELRRPGPSFTVDTLRALHERGDGGELFLLLGADAARELPTWKDPAEVARLAQIVVVDRAGDGTGADLGFDVSRVRVTRVDVSATELRRRVAAGASIRYLVPDAVRRIVEREGLYRTQL